MKTKYAMKALGCTTQPQFAAMFDPPVTRQAVALWQKKGKIPDLREYQLRERHGKTFSRYDAEQTRLKEAKARA